MPNDIEIKPNDEKIIDAAKAAAPEGWTECFGGFDNTKTDLAAYDEFFERLGINLYHIEQGEFMLIIGAEIGLGFIGVQVAQMIGYNVIASATTPETKIWLERLGVEHIISANDDLVSQTQALGHDEFDHIIIFNGMQHISAASELISTEQTFVTVDDARLFLSIAAMRVETSGEYVDFVGFPPTRHNVKVQNELFTQIAQQIGGAKIKSRATSVLDEDTSKIAVAMFDVGVGDGLASVGIFTKPDEEL